MSKEFKAGDFSRGKMNEIFKTCFTREGLYTDHAIIKHRQFGRAFLVNEHDIYFATRMFLVDNEDFHKYVEVVMSKHNSYFDEDDELSKFDCTHTLLSCMPLDDFMKIVEDWFYESIKDIEGEDIKSCQFESVLHLFLYLVCEKGDTY